MRIGAHDLSRAAEAVLEAAGSAAPEAAIVADHLVRAHLAGHDSHGVGMIPSYVRSLARGTLRPNTPARLVRDDGAILMFDGGRGFGQRVAREAMDVAIGRCRAHGVVLMTLRSAHHAGRIGAYGEQAVAAGLVSLHFVNVHDHGPLVAPFRGTDARFGTNPLCIAIPGTAATPPVLLDMATSRIALGKVRVARNEGRTVAPGNLLDARGLPTVDPRVMFEDAAPGALLPAGEHKGYGLALACEILGGVLSGGGTIAPEHPRRGGIVNNMLAVLFDPARLVATNWMAREIDAVVAYAKASPAADPEAPVLVAGEPERRSAAERAEHGIPVDEATWRELERAAESVGLSAVRLRELARV